MDGSDDIILSSASLELSVLLRVALATREDPEPERDRDDADQEQRPDVGPERAQTDAVEDRGANPVSAYVAGENFASHCIHSGSTETG